jgi:hypothetical protein
MGASIAQKVFTGGTSLRKTRLHDEKGHQVGLNNLVFHGPKAAWSWGMMRLFDHRPSEPWIAYSAIKVLREFLNTQSRVLEFGSGMSTIWYGRHAGEVYSVDHYPLWFQKVQGLLAKEKNKNVHHFLREDPKSYSHFADKAKKGFDLVMVDGEWRSRSAIQGAKLVKPGGVIYLDNSDKDSTSEGGDTREAEKFLLKFAKQKKAKVTYFVDFAPTQFFIQEGMLVQMKG